MTMMLPQLQVPDRFGLVGPELLAHMLTMSHPTLLQLHLLHIVLLTPRLAV